MHNFPQGKSGGMVNTVGKPNIWVDYLKAFVCLTIDSGVSKKSLLFIKCI
jgi:hypothetical protein